MERERQHCSFTTNATTTCFPTMKELASVALDSELNERNVTNFEENIRGLAISKKAKQKWSHAYIFRFLDPERFEVWAESLIVKKGEPNFFKEPFSSIWQKVGALATYLLQVTDLFIILAFVAYERQGLAGPFRTVINQLVSHLYLMEVLYIMGPSSIDLIGIWLGPLPSRICEINTFAKNCLCIQALLLMLSITFIKFMFICVWKNMRQLEDDFLVRFIIRSTLVVSILVSLSKSMVHPSELIMNNVVCTGHFNPLKQVGEAPFPVYEAVAALAFFVYIGLMIAISAQRRKIQKDDQNHGINANVAPKSLENLALYFSIMLTLLLAVLFTMIRMNPLHLHEGLNWILPFYNMYLGPTMVMTFTAIKIVIVNGKDIQRELFGVSIQPIMPSDSRPISN